MKKDIHPTYFPEAKISCASCGKEWTTGSTKEEIRLDVCSNCHPFFTGEAQRLLDTEGQVDRFYKKLSARQAYVEKQKEKEELQGSPDRPIAEMELPSRAMDALAKAGIENFGDFIAKLEEGNAAVLAIPGFGQASLTAAKKKMKALGYEIPEAAAS